MKKYVDHIFEFEPKSYLLDNGDSIELRVDCTVELIYFNQPYEGYDLSSVEIHEITSLYDGKDLTSLKDSAALYSEIVDQCDKSINYLVSKIGE